MSALGLAAIMSLQAARELAEELRFAPFERLAACRDRLACLEEAIALLEAAGQKIGYSQLRYVRYYLHTGGWVLHGMASAAHWAAWRLNLRLRTARERVRVAEALESLPLVDAAFAAGELEYSRVRAITRVATPRDEAEWVALARTLSCDELDRRCREAGGVPPGDDPPARWVVGGPTSDGMFELRARLRPEEGALLMKSLDACVLLAHGLGVPDASPRPAPVRPRGSAEPSAQFTRADALATVANSFLARQDRPARSPGRFEVLVRVDQGVLRGTAVPGPSTPCELEEGVPLDPETVRRLSCDAAVVEYSAVGAPKATVELDLGRRTRTIPPSLKRALRLRDGPGCRWPGCRNQIFVDGHHLEHWAQGGETSLANLLHLCSVHHPLVHEGGYRVELHEDGSASFYDPFGRLIPDVPELPCQALLFAELAGGAA